MAGLADIRAQHPEYNDLSDQALADGMYKKYYSDMPRAVFDQKMGLSVSPTERFKEADPQTTAERPAALGAALDEKVAATRPGFWETGGTGEDIAAGIQHGVVKGMADVAGAPSNLFKGVVKGLDYLTGTETPIPGFIEATSGQGIRDAASKATGIVVPPSKGAGVVAEHIAQAVPAAAALGPGGAVGNAVKFAVAPVAAGEAARAVAPKGSEDKYQFVAELLTGGAMGLKRGGPPTRSIKAIAAERGPVVLPDIRARATAVLANAKQVAQLSPVELTYVQAVANGTTTENILRGISNLPEDSHLARLLDQWATAAGASAGAAVASTPGAVAGAAIGAAVSKTAGAAGRMVAGALANHITKRNVKVLDSITRGGEFTPRGAPVAAVTASEQQDRPQEY